MASVRLAKKKSVIKGYHVYRSCPEAGFTITCSLDPENVHSRDAINVLAEEEIVGPWPTIGHGWACSRVTSQSACTIVCTNNTVDGR